MSDYRRALELDESFGRAKEGLQTAQKRQKQAGKRDYYKILGVRRNANKRTINKAYRKLAQKWHPDNFQDEDEKKKAEKKFMDIAAAKEVLSDEGKSDFWIIFEHWATFYLTFLPPLYFLIHRDAPKVRRRRGPAGP